MSQNHRAPGRGTAFVMVGAFLAVLLSAVLAIVRLPYAVIGPGPAFDTLGTMDDGSSLITVKEQKTYPTSGSLFFTTASILGGPDRHVTGWEVVQGALDPNQDVLPEEQVYPADATTKQVEEEQQAQMAGSQQEAIAIALRSTGETVPSIVTVSAVGDDAAAKGILEVDDRVIAVDGHKASNAAEIVERVRDREPGDKVEMTVVRDGAQRTVNAPTAKGSEGQAALGVLLASEFDLPYPVTIDAGDVGGPSAGMMFALAVRDVITPGAMTGGAAIAGTGTIDDAGAVGPIGSIDHKLVGAKRAGATWFLAPESNCDEVVGHVPDGLTVVSVATFDDAVKAVDAIAAGETSGPAPSDLSSCG
ncbi:YlbL family protein [Janibacter sp. G1551]|uniref:YlbL family protein n=1 Tax=Janibacter sp. G1551 TaxID=3420440 RepID=UPI003D00335A